MTVPVLSCDAIRALEQRAQSELGMPTLLLMENAGLAIAEKLIDLGIDGPVVVLCGKGNNGGDGMVVARHLDNRGFTVQVLLFADPEALKGDAAINCNIVKKCNIPFGVHSEKSLDKAKIENELIGAQWLVDALFGSGLKGALRSPFDELVEWVNQSEASVLSVDIPSGLSGEGEPPAGAVIEADHTVTLIASKPGFRDSEAKQYLGELHYHDAGLPRRLMPSN